MVTQKYLELAAADKVPPSYEIIQWANAVTHCGQLIAPIECLIGRWEGFKIAVLPPYAEGNWRVDVYDYEESYPTLETAIAAGKAIAEANVERRMTERAPDDMSPEDILLYLDYYSRCPGFKVSDHPAAAAASDRLGFSPSL